MNAVFTKDAISDIGIDSECSICAQLRDPVTKTPRFNAETFICSFCLFTNVF